MTRILWALLITGLVLLGFVKAVQAFGGPIVIIALVVLAAVAIKGRNAYVGHQASGLDAANQPGRAVTVADRTSRWWDTEHETEHHWPVWLAWALGALPFTEIRIGSLDRSRRQLRDIAGGEHVRALDWTAPNRNGGAAFGGGMTASGMTYDWCTCSEQAMPLIMLPDGSAEVNRGERSCVCQCSECAPKGSYTDIDGKRKPIKPRHWRERDAEHEIAVGNAVKAEQARRPGAVWRRRRAALRALIEDVRADRADRAKAAAMGYEDIQARRDRGEHVNTDTDEWHWRKGHR